MTEFKEWDATTCPQCGEIAEIVWRDVLQSTDGPVEHAYVRCLHRHWFFDALRRSRCTEHVRALGRRIDTHKGGDSMSTRTLAAAAGTVALAAARAVAFVLAGVRARLRRTSTTQFADQHGPLGQID